MRGLGSVCVCGLGTVGYPVALHIRKSGFNVCGYDLKSVEAPIPVSDELPNCDVYVVAVNTSSVVNVCRRIGEANPDALVCIESTVPIGTSRKIAENYGLKVSVCPHRYWREDPVKRGVSQPRVLGAYDGDVLREAKAFYEKLGIPVVSVGSLEVAESTKLIENAHRFIQVAYAEEIRQLCQRRGLDFDAVRCACNTKWNCSILEAREGILTHLLKDIHLLVDSSTPLMNGAIKADLNYKNEG